MGEPTGRPRARPGSPEDLRFNRTETVRLSGLQLELANEAAKQLGITRQKLMRDAIDIVERSVLGIPPDGQNQLALMGLTVIWK